MRLAVEDLQFDERGLIPAIVQDFQTKEVLTLAFMNEESLRRTLTEGETWFWSRSRQKLWHKGETSGNTQRVVDVALDCDADALRILVEPRGPACHTGARSCFHHQLQSVAEDDSSSRLENVEEAKSFGAVLDELYMLIASRKLERPKDSYTTYLFEKGLDKILKKVGEESAETIIAAKNEARAPFTAEVADLIYHLLVLLVERGVTLEEIGTELAARRGGKQNDA